VPQPRNPDIPRGNLGPTPALPLTAPGISVSVAEARQNKNFAVYRNGQVALCDVYSAYRLANDLMAFMRLGIEPLANLRSLQSYPSIQTGLTNSRSPR